MLTSNKATIPGRPPLHERSSSAPEDVRDDKHRAALLMQGMKLLDDEEFTRAIENAFTQPNPSTRPLGLTRRLQPLVIPRAYTASPMLQSLGSDTKPRSDSTPPTSSSRFGRMDISPMSHHRITPSTSTPDLSCPKSANMNTATVITLNTPVSAPIAEPQRAFPGTGATPTATSANKERCPISQTPDGLRRPPNLGHRRGVSDSSSMMDRGRPRKRTEIRPNNAVTIKGSDHKRPKSAERRAFEELPTGWKPSEATQVMQPDDLLALQKQAFGQAERFEVLKVEDVEALSKELRHLDERTDYLRRTYTSLRAGRRNLHSRICQYLRSPRVAKFSHESMLKQEEALAELDASIDDWVTKLEQADNRRTRVRQKLLEHVAAATILLVPNDTDSAPDALPQPVCIQSPGPRELSTPPRSPSKQSFSERASNHSPSPQRVVAQVPSTIIEQPVIETAPTSNGQRRVASTSTLNRSDVQSIRIYAGDDVYALLADVENEIFKMGSSGGSSGSSSSTLDKQGLAIDSTQQAERIKHARQRSHEKLSGLDGSSVSTATKAAAATPSPTVNTATSSSVTLASKAADTPIPTTTGGVTINKDSTASMSQTAPVALAPPVKDTCKDSEILTSAVFRP